VRPSTRPLSRVVRRYSLGPVVLALVTSVYLPAATAAELKSFQRGTTTVAATATATTITLSPTVDATKAILVFGVSENNDVPADGQISGQITTAATDPGCPATMTCASFQRVGAGGTVTVTWYVVEFVSGVRVQRGSIPPCPAPSPCMDDASNPASVDVPISAVDRTKTFPLISLRTTGISYDSGDFYRAKLTTDTNLRIVTPDAGAAVTVEWQVVEYQDAKVQTGDLSFTNTDLSLNASLPTAVNTAKSWLIYDYECTPFQCDGDLPNMGSKLMRGVVTDSTTLTFDRNNTGLAGESIDLTWYLVEFTDGTTVQSGSEPFTTTETERNVTLAMPATGGASIASSGGFYLRGGRSGYNADDVAGVGLFRFDLTSPTNLRITRGTTGPGTPATADAGWFVVTFAPSQPRVLSGTYTGDGTAGRPITGLGFRPDVVIIKGDAAQDPVWRTSTMFGDATKPAGGDTSAPLAPNLIQSLDGNGFTIGSSAAVNGAATTYSWVAFEAAPGFLDLGTYAGTGATQTISGLTLTPDLVVVLGESSGVPFHRTASMPGGTSSGFGGSGLVTQAITAFGAGSFDVGTAFDVNAAGESYHYLAFKKTSGWLNEGTYTGNGTSQSVATGFSPEYVSTKDDNTAIGVHRTASLGACDCTLSWKDDLNGNGQITALTASGFDVASSARANGILRTYYWFAFPKVITTEVRLQSFAASGRDRAVYLAWVTASELDNLGFHLRRSSSPNGPFEQITPALIPGLGCSPTGTTYAYRDSGLVNGQTYFYELEDVETSGRTTSHGPVSATPAPGGASADPGSGSSGAPGDGGIAYGEPEGVSFRVAERGSGYAVLELLTPGFYAVPEGDGLVRLEVPGFDGRTVPGAPAVAVKRAFVEALAGRGVRLTSIVASDEVRFPGLNVEAAEAPSLVVTNTGMVKAGVARKRGRPEAHGTFPLQAARILGASFQGETKKARVELAPLRYDPLTATAILSRRLVVRVEFSGVVTGERVVSGARGRRLLPAPIVRGRGLVAELVAPEAALYAVRFESVFGGLRGVLAASLRLSRHGQTVAHHIEPDRATFGPGSVLYFLSEGSASNPWGEAVYELEAGKSGASMAVVSGAPSGVDATEYVDEKNWRQNRYYQAGLLEALDLWQWDLLVSPVEKSYPVALSDVSSSGSPARLTVWLQGASDFDVTPDHHVRVSLNGQVVGEASWEGKAPRTIEAEVPPGLLTEGGNTLSLANVGDTPAAYSMVFLNRFSLAYPRKLVAEAGALSGRFEDSGTARVSGLGFGFVLDVQERQPKWVHGAVAAPGGLSFRAEAGRKYLAVAAAAVKTPRVERPMAARLRRTTHRADWLLVAPREFLDAAEPLVEMRRRQGLAVEAVALEQIDQEFGFGERSPAALKDFLEYAYQSWRRPSFRYLVLLGDGSYDPKNYLKTGKKDRIPPMIVRTSYLWTASDPAYASLNGEDLLPDVAVGRLPASTVEEARRLVEKVVAFETAGRNLDGKAVLVADNADLGGLFEAESDELAVGVLAGRDVAKVYLRDLGGATRATVRSELDGGAGIVSYTGHGGTAVWASENIFNNTDVASLAPQAQQPLLLTMNCLNGFFHFPPLDSLAEAFVKAEGKGAIAAFSPSGLSLDQPAHVYEKAVLQELQSGRHRRLGDAILAAQMVYVDSGTNPELVSVYHLLGDPALKLR
jgi:hypothetical protein